MQQHRIVPTAESKLAALQEIAKITSVLVVSASATSFVFGLLIVNCWLASRGIQPPEFARADYILSGVVFVALVAVAYLSFVHGSGLCKAVPTYWREKRWRRFVWALTGVVVWVITVPMTVVMLSHFTDSLSDWRLWLGCLLLAGTPIYFRKLFLQLTELWRRLARDATAPAADKSYYAQQATLAIDLLLGLLISIGSYATLIYPRIWMAYGGGYRTAVYLSPTPIGSRVMESLKLPLEQNGHIGPLYVLSQTDSTLFVTTKPPESSYAPTLRLDRTLFDAITIDTNMMAFSGRSALPDVVARPHARARVAASSH